MPSTENPIIMESSNSDTPPARTTRTTRVAQAPSNSARGTGKPKGYSIAPPKSQRRELKEAIKNTNDFFSKPTPFVHGPATITTQGFLAALVAMANKVAALRIAGGKRWSKEDKFQWQNVLQMLWAALERLEGKKLVDATKLRGEVLRVLQQQHPDVGIWTPFAISSPSDEMWYEVECLYSYLITRWQEAEAVQKQKTSGSASNKEPTVQK